jgi:hypothetical protein
MLETERYPDPRRFPQNCDHRLQNFHFAQAVRAMKKVFFCFHQRSVSEPTKDVFIYFIARWVKHLQPILKRNR